MKWNSVKDKDMGYGEMIEVFRELSAGDVIVEVGVPEEAGDYKDGPSQVLVAAANEYGTSDGRVPERSYLRSTMDEKREHFANHLEKALGRVINGKMTISQALESLGLEAVKQVQKKIVALDSPPNAPATLKRKKSSNPLIDTGQLRQSIIHRVRVNDGDSGA